MTSPALRYTFLDQNLLLLPEKALFWEDERALIVADVHLGKVGHFRKAGIAIPKQLEQDDLGLLSDLIHEYKPRSLIFLGDLFHSEYNNDWEWLVMWRSLFKDIEFILIRGNHDILNDKLYTDLDFALHSQLEIGPFLFSHEPLKPKLLESSIPYVISGHIHPGVTLTGGARQMLTIPCFQFGAKQAVLPAFGKFTGKACVKRNKSDRIFGITRHKVVAF